MYSIKIILILSFFTFPSFLLGGPPTYLHDLQKSISQHQRAQSFHEWEDSEFSPGHLFEKYNKTLNTPEKKRALCNALRKIQSRDLVVFYNALSETSLGKSLPCTPILLIQLNAYFERREMALSQKEFSLNNLRSKKSIKPPLTLGPSQEVTIDTHGGPVFFHADLNEKEIALTFDDGPHSLLTLKLLEILDEENIQATFFLVGKNVKAHPHIVQSLQDNKHSIGNHSWSHKNFPRFDDKGVQSEIDLGLNIIWETLGFYTPFFRFPYGAHTPFGKNYLRSQNTSAFYWNMDTLDWKLKDPEELFEYALEQVEEYRRGIILFHDVQPQTITMMPYFLRELKAQNYKPVVFRAAP